MFQRVILALGAMALAAPALAGDLPSAKSAPSAPPPAEFNWTGVYLGAYGGGVGGWVYQQDSVTGVHYTQSPAGAVAGGLVGYNYQFNRNGVAGIEGEGGYQTYRTLTGFTVPGSTTAFTQVVDSDYTARLRGRLGYAAGNALLFVAGGASFSDISVQEYGVARTGAFGSYKITHSAVGLNVGGGLDFAITPNWIARVEYIYEGFGRQAYAFSALPLTGAVHFDNHDVSADIHTIRAAAIYKFDAPPPASVVAKY
jgi:outer membrane immunogenic protein